MELGDGAKEALLTNSVLSFVVTSLSERCFEAVAGNEGAIALANNLLNSARAKNVDVGFRFIRELVRSKTTSVIYVPTKAQFADLLTKALTGAKFRAHRGFLVNLHV